MSEVRGPKVVVVEESHMAAWVKRVLEPYVDKLVICDPQRNAWIAKDEFNNDTSSAIKLAKLQLDGYIKEIVHPEEEGAKLRSLFLHYYDLNQQLTRFKNKLKAVFRSEAIATGGKKIYAEEGRKNWLSLRKGQTHLQHTAGPRFELIDKLEELKEATYKEMVELAKKHKAFELIDGMPGAGPVIACGYIAMIDTPHRFSRKNKLWKYASLGNRYHDSDGEVYLSGASKRRESRAEMGGGGTLHARGRAEQDGQQIQTAVRSDAEERNGQDGGETACVPGAGVGGAGDLDQRGGVSGQTVTETQTLRTQA